MKGKRLDDKNNNNNNTSISISERKKNCFNSNSKRNEAKLYNIFAMCDIQYTNRQMSWLLKMVANKRTNELNACYVACNLQQRPEDTANCMLQLTHTYTQKENSYHVIEELWMQWANKTYHLNTRICYRCRGTVCLFFGRSLSASRQCLSMCL